MEANANAPVRDQSPNDFENLKRSLQGPLLLPGMPGYEDARTVWNAMIDRRPAAIARCSGTADVLAGVTFAREQGLGLSVKGGGHNISGLAVCDGGLMLDMSLMRGVWVDRNARTARAEAGCLLSDVDRETQLLGTNYQRLVEIKTRWDPTNMFRINKNIPPSTGASAPTRTP